MDRSGHPGFDNLPEAAQPEHRHHRQVIHQPAPHASTQSKQLFHGIGQQEAETEVDDPVEVVAPEMQHLLHPRTGRHLRIGIMNPDRMERQEDRDEAIRRMGQRQDPVCRDQHEHENSGQDARQEPELRIGRRLRGPDRHCHVPGQQSCQNALVAVGHRLSL